MRRVFHSMQVCDRQAVHKIRPFFAGDGMCLEAGQDASALLLVCVDQPLHLLMVKAAVCLQEQECVSRLL